jgi:hypothetical protein
MADNKKSEIAFGVMSSKKIIDEHIERTGAS